MFPRRRRAGGRARRGGPKARVRSKYGAQTPMTLAQMPVDVVASRRARGHPRRRRDADSSSVPGRGAPMSRGIVYGALRGGVVRREGSGMASNSPETRREVEEAALAAEVATRRAAGDAAAGDETAQGAAGHARHANDWRVLLVFFILAGIVESQAFGHLGAFTPIFLGDLRVPEAQIPTWTGILSALGFVIGLPLLPFWGVADRA